MLRGFLGKRRFNAKAQSATRSTYSLAGASPAGKVGSNTFHIESWIPVGNQRD